MNEERTQDTQSTAAPSTDVMQRLADALEDTHTGEAADVTLATEPGTPLLPRRAD